MSVLDAFGMLTKDGLDAHRCFRPQRDKGRLPVHAHRPKRRLHAIEVVDANRRTMPPASDGEMEFFLVVHQATNGRIFRRFVVAKVDPVNRRTEDDWANVGQFVVHGHGRRCWFHVKGGVHRFVVKKGAHGTRQCFCGEKVRTVWKNFDVEGGFVAQVDVGPKQWKTFLQGSNVVHMTGLGHEGLKDALLDADGWHVVTSSNRAVGVRILQHADRS